MLRQILTKEIRTRFMNKCTPTCIRCYCETHYDVLKLSRDCTAKDIRESFLKLSKEYHPDKSNKDTHGKFVKISEAYNVLSKPVSRRNYDLGLLDPVRGQRNVVYYAERPVWTDDTIWEYRNRAEDEYYASKPYYGIKGLKKVSNFAIVIFCMIFTVVGVIIQIFAIRSSFTLKRDQLEKYSSELADIHANVRRQALENGNEKQLELLKERLNYKEKGS